MPWRRRHSQVETGSLGAQPLPRVSHPNPALLGFATSKPPIALPFDHIGTTMDLPDGDTDLLLLSMDSMNSDPDPEAEDRKVE